MFPSISSGISTVSPCSYIRSVLYREKTTNSWWRISRGEDEALLSNCSNATQNIARKAENPIFPFFSLSNTMFKVSSGIQEKYFLSHNFFLNFSQRPSLDSQLSFSWDLEKEERKKLCGRKYFIRIPEGTLNIVPLREKKGKIGFSSKVCWFLSCVSSLFIERRVCRKLLCSYS